MKKKFLVPMLTLFLLLFAGCSAAEKEPDEAEIDLNDYIEIEYSGYDGYAEAWFIIDYVEIIDDYEDYFDVDAKDLDDGDEDAWKLMEKLQEAVSGKLRNASDLSNGDSVKFKWDIDADDFEDDYDVVFVYEDFEEEVENLDELKEVDPLKGVEFIFNGSNGDGYLTYDTSDWEYSFFDFYVSSENYLSNGDELTVYLDDDYMDACLREGVIPEYTSTNITVSGLEELTYHEITVWTTYDFDMQYYVEALLEAFDDAHPELELDFNILYGDVYEIAETALANPKECADLFVFSQEHAPQLLAAGLLDDLSYSQRTQLKNTTMLPAIDAATFGNYVYGYPFALYNGYFMYYDKSVIEPSSVDNLAAIIHDCELAGRKFAMDLESSWYTASFFFAADCVSEWEIDSDGNFVSVNDTFNSDMGIVALKGMQKLLKSDCYMQSSSSYVFDDNAAVLVSGSWCYNDAKEALGSNLGMAPLPRFTVEGIIYPLHTFSSYQFWGVKPTANTKKADVLHQIALWLSGEEAQQMFYENCYSYPTNLALQEAYAPYDEILNVLKEQMTYSVPQGPIHGSWWDIARYTAIGAKSATTDAELKAVLQNYENQLYALFNMDYATETAFTVIGSINGDSWTTDLPMEELEEGVWVTTKPYYLYEGDEFKCRQGKNWDVAYGNNGYNYVVESSGSYWIMLVVYDGYGYISLVAE